jgi:hypothetical protein
LDAVVTCIICSTKTTACSRFLHPRNNIQASRYQIKLPAIFIAGFAPTPATARTTRKV